jgi:hypothetical protein
MNTINRFTEIIRMADLWHWFISEFGDDWKAKEWYLDGWWFDGNTISYRACDLFDDHSEGYNWSFYYDDYLSTVLVHVLKSHGFIITHNSGDEEDGLFTMALNAQ